MSATLSSPQGGTAILANLVGSAGASTTTTNVNHSVANSYPVGSSAGQVRYVYTSILTVTSGTPATIDLTSLVDPQGNSNTLAAWVEILIENQSVTTGQDFTAGGGTNPAFAAEGALIPAGGGYLKIGDPLGTTVDSTHKIVQLTVAAGTSVPVRVTILGR